MEVPSADEERAAPAPQASAPLWQQWHVSGAGRQILFAVLVAAVAFGVRWLLDPLLGNRQPFTPAFAAVAIVAWFASWRAGLLTAVVCHLLSNYFFIAPRHSFTVNMEELAGAGTYYLIAGVIVFLGHSATRANRSLSEMVETLRGVNLRKSEFLAVLGHELRNPLATIRTSLDLLKSGALDETETRSTHAMMERQVGQMHRLVEDLLDIARIDQGKIVLQPASVPVAAAVADAVEAARIYTEPMGQSVTIDVRPGVETVEADPARMHQVLTNLLHNASKFSPRASLIEVTAKPVPSGIAIRVRDRGAGMPRTQIDSIFGSFVQLDPVGSSQSGLGLGLTVVRKLMDLHGGTVRARSDGPGRGSEFTVVFPRGRPRAAAGAPVSEAPTSSQPDSLRLMVVDDNRDAADSLAMLLELKGHEVITANDGASALRCATQQPLDIVFLDLGMPDMDGFEVAQRMRREIKGRQPTLVALTGWGSEEDQRRSRNAGFDRHLTKPVSMESLEEVLQENGSRIEGE